MSKCICGGAFGHNPRLDILCPVCDEVADLSSEPQTPARTSPPPQRALLKEEIRKCFRDTYMETEGETELFDTEETINALGAFIKSHTTSILTELEEQAEWANIHWSEPEKLISGLTSSQVVKLSAIKKIKEGL